MTNKLTLQYQEDEYTTQDRFQRLLHSQELNLSLATTGVILTVLASLGGALVAYMGLSGFGINHAGLMQLAHHLPQLMTVLGTVLGGSVIITGIAFKANDIYCELFPPNRPIG